MTKNRSLIFGLIFLVVSLLGYGQSARFFQAYLVSFLFWSELALGSMALLMVFHLTGGRWAATTRPRLEAAMGTIEILAVLFVPLIFGVTRIYPWADPVLANADPRIAHKMLYLNPTAFSLRAVFYFLSWAIFARALLRPGVTPDTLKRLSAGGLVFLGFSISFAAIDWQMSLEPTWYSTVYGMVFGVGQALGAWAFIMLISATSTRENLIDQGNILLTLIMTWAYLSFMQYLIVWSGNLPEEVIWFNHRTQNGWKWFAYALILFQFALPFSALLFRDFKRRPGFFSALCAIILLVRIVDRYWLVMPALHPEAVSISWMDLTLLLGLGGVWVSCFLSRLSEVKHAQA